MSGLFVVGITIGAEDRSNQLRPYGNRFLADLLHYETILPLDFRAGAPVSSKEDVDRTFIQNRRRQERRPQLRFIGKQRRQHQARPVQIGFLLRMVENGLQTAVHSLTGLFAASLRYN